MEKQNITASLHDRVHGEICKYINGGTLDLAEHIAFNVYICLFSITVANSQILDIDIGKSDAEIKLL